MERDEAWQVIDAERGTLADQFDDLSPAEWQTPSLCADWRVRDVAAHLTLSQTGMLAATVALVRAGGSFNRMVRDTAKRQARLPTEQYSVLLRAMIGSRRTAPGLTHLEPLLDVLVHGQDIAVPLGRARPVPPRAAAAATARVWPDRWPFRAQRRLHGFTFAATDTDWSAGRGPLVEGPMGAILLLLTGRSAALSQLGGPGLDELTARLSPARKV